MPQIKINILIACLIILFSILLSRSFYLSVPWLPTSLSSGTNNSPPPSAPAPASSASAKNTTSPPPIVEKNPPAKQRPQTYALLPRTQRGSIVDRNNTLLAYSTYAYNLYLDGREQTPLNKSSIAKIAELLNIAPERIADNLYNNRVTLLKRFASQAKARLLYQLKTPHFLTDRVLQRTYPNKALMAQTLGFVGHDEHGLVGLEKQYETELSTFKGQAKGKEVHLQLAVDKHLNFTIAQKLKAIVLAKNAKVGVVLVQDVATRALRALSIYPTFDLNYFNSENPEIFRNNATSYIIEPGSIFKVIFSAYLLEKHPELDIHSKDYFCKGYYELENGEIINCTGTHGEVSLSDIISYSCNAGMIEAAKALSKHELIAYLAQLGIGAPTGIDLPGEEKGILPPSSEWGRRTRATSVIGQGIGVTPLQLINVFTTVVGDGWVKSPQLNLALHYYEDQRHTATRPNPTLKQRGKQVLQAATTAKIRELLKNGVRADSTGHLAKSNYLQILGKTSTSQIANTRKGGYYTHKYHSLFAGAYPETQPQFTVLVLIMLSEYDYQGGRSAAPLFADILDAIVRSYQLTNERSQETITLAAINNTPASKPATVWENSTLAEHFHLPAMPSPFSAFPSSAPSHHHATPPAVPAPSIDNSLSPIAIAPYSTRKVPNFKNMSLRHALSVLDKLTLENFQRNYHVSYKIVGTGYVKRQHPPPQQAIRGDVTMTLFLGNR